MSKKRKKNTGRRKSSRGARDREQGKSTGTHDDRLRKKDGPDEPAFRYTLDLVTPTRPAVSQIVLFFAAVIVQIGWCAVLVSIHFMR